MVPFCLSLRSHGVPRGCHTEIFHNSFPGTWEDEQSLSLEAREAGRVGPGSNAGRRLPLGLKAQSSGHHTGHRERSQHPLPLTLHAPSPSPAPSLSSPQSSQARWGCLSCGLSAPASQSPPCSLLVLCCVTMCLSDHVQENTAQRRAQSGRGREIPPGQREG